MVFGFLLFGGTQPAVAHTIRKRRSPGGKCPVFWLLQYSDLLEIKALAYLPF